MLRLLAGLTAVAALVFGMGAVFTTVPFYLPVLAVVLTVVALLAEGMPLPALRVPYVMRCLIGVFNLSFLLLGTITVVDSLGLVPESIQDYLPPPHAAIIAAILTLINFAICYVRVIRQIIDLADPYFTTEEQGELSFGWLGTWRATEGNIGLAIFVFILLINVAQVYLLVLFNTWNNRFYNALQDKDVSAFWREILVFTVLAFLIVYSRVYENYITQFLGIRWRRWLSKFYIDKWMVSGVHYRMRLAGDAADNPDQRIAEDVRDFIINTRNYYVQLFSAVLNLYAFVQILWRISAEFPYKIGSTDLGIVPGYLVWMALSLALVATVITHIIGRPLVVLNFENQRREANFRFNLVRLREYSEQVTLSQGERFERIGLVDRFNYFAAALLALIRRQKTLGWFTNSYGQASIILPYIVLAPAYFASATMKQGYFFQAADAFGRVSDQFSIFVDLYTGLATYKAVVNRLLGFEKSIDSASQPIALQVAAGPKGGNIDVGNVDVALPDKKPLIGAASLTLQRGVRALITGASGSGKTTFMRVLRGIWPYATGRVSVPAGDDVMLLPQQAYMPLGTLRAVLSYPATEDAFADADIRMALEKVGLGAFAERLDTIENWSNVLSGGEQQRVSLVRALLRKPAWLFLDEATAAVDEATEASLYGLLREALPNTTIVSIGHRSSLAALHDRRIHIVKNGAKAHLEDAPLETFGAKP